MRTFYYSTVRNMDKTSSLMPCSVLKSLSDATQGSLPPFTLQFLPDLRALYYANDAVQAFSIDDFATYYDEYCRNVLLAISTGQIAELESASFKLHNLIKLGQSPIVFIMLTSHRSLLLDMISFWDDYLYEVLVLHAIPRLGYEINMAKVANLQEYLQNMPLMLNSTYHAFPCFVQRRLKVAEDALVVLRRRLTLHFHAQNLVSLLNDKTIITAMRSGWETIDMDDVVAETAWLMDNPSQSPFKDCA
ncbi:hypothetical protein BC940DRAFT_132914 [Gongronella butleri]|nr:hypothetical protein BC940DRAFT_132914 [Gongronella butleri]